MTVTLVPMTAAQARALAQGRGMDNWHPDYPTDGDALAARLWLEGQWDPAPCHVLLAGSVVGSIGTKGPVIGSWAEIGYGLVAAVRGRGVMTRALPAYLQILRTHGVTRVLAETATGNVASKQLLIGAGFCVTRESTEDALFSKCL